jgi:hypothetical protein
LSSLRRPAGAIVLCALFLALPSVASATTQITSVSTTASGCQVKGVGLTPAPKAAATPGLAAGTYRYIVTAVSAGGESTPCAPVFTIAGGAGVGQDSVLLQWEATPGALAYRVYRSDSSDGFSTSVGLVVAAGPVFTVPFNAVCPPGGTGTGPRCAFQDNNAATAAATPPPGPAALTQAGSHPDLNITTRLDYGGASANDGSDDPLPDGSATSPTVKTLKLHFPAGVIANPRAGSATCPLTGANSLLGDLTKYGRQDAGEDSCPVASEVGTVATLTRVRTGVSSSITLPTVGSIYQGTPKAGEAGRLYIVLRPGCSAGSPIDRSSATCKALTGDASGNSEFSKQFLAGVAEIVKRDDGSYAIDVNTVNAEDDGPLATTLTKLTPDGSSNLQPGPGLSIQVQQLTQHLFGSALQATADGSDDAPFVTLPTSSGAKTFAADATTWADATTQSGSNPSLVTSGTDNVPFQPTSVTSVDTREVGQPVGLATGVQLPASSGAIHQAHVKTLVATLPRGVVLSAPSGNVVTAAGAQIGTVSGTSDELGPLTGTLVLQSIGTDAGGHFNGTLGLRATIKPSAPASSDVSIVIDGTSTVDPVTGQLHAVFDNLPEVPFTRLTLNFAGGPNAALANPVGCGTNTVDATFAPYSGRTSGAADNVLAGSSSYSTTFDGSDGSACPDPRPFSPTLSASATPSTSGAYSTVVLTVGRGDKDRNLGAFSFDLPPGMLAQLGGVPPCPSAQADAGTCDASSKVGSVSIKAGTGSDPVTVPGSIYLAAPMAGTSDVASLDVVVPVKVGPFDLGTVVSRSRLRILPIANNLVVRVSAETPLPTMAAGIPVRVRELKLTIDHANFQRNPSSCGASAFNASFASGADPTTTASAAEGGAGATASSPFASTGCSGVPYAPKVTGVLSGDQKPAGHPALAVTVSQTTGESATKSSQITFPSSLAANAAALAKTCTEAQLASGPANCPAGATVGTASASSPLVPGSLSGPVVLLANPGGLPKLAILLNGIISLRLDASISVSPSGQIVNTFPAIPDVPLNTFVVKLAGGTGGLLSNVRDLCGGAGQLGAAFTGHNGANTSASTTLQVDNAQTCATSKPAVSGSLSGVKRGLPVLKLTAARKGAVGSDRIKRVKVTLPQALFLNRKHSTRVSATTGGKKLKRSALALTTRTLTVTGLGNGSTKVGASFPAASLHASRLARAKAKKQTVSVVVAVTDGKGRIYKTTLKLRPRS